MDQLDEKVTMNEHLGTAVIDEAELAKRKSDLEELVELMRPAVQMDGGDISVTDVDYENGII